MVVKISEVLELQLGHVKIRNIEELERKLNKLVDGGKDNLQVIADFDCTLTKQRVDNGNAIVSSFGMFSQCPSVPEKYKNDDKKLSEIYKPIEVDPTLSIETKTKHMEEWYRLGNDILTGFQFPAEELKHVAKHVTENLRDGVHEMLGKLNETKVPVLVFSAGLGDAVVAVLENSNNLTANVKVISNFLNIDENGTICGLKGKIIHVFNKNETVIKGTEYYDMIKKKITSSCLYILYY